MTSPSPTLSVIPASTAPDNPTTLQEVLRYFFALPSPNMLVILLATFWTLRISLANWSLWDAAAAAVILALWPLKEWCIHVFILHLKPVNILGRTVHLASAAAHHQHHEAPYDLTKVTMLPRQVFSGLILNMVIWFGLMPTTELALTGLATTLTLALNYEWTHFYIHTSYRPKLKFMRNLRKNHLLHHFRNEQHWYGVSRLGGDWLLGTGGEKQDVPKSEHCKTLGYERK